MIETRSRTGALADISGVHGKRNADVYISQSSICSGRGIFAGRFIPNGTLITKYAGDVMPHDMVPKGNLYVLDMSEDVKDKSRQVHVGIDDPTQLHHKGVAQLANDAISKTLTGRENNTRFFTNSRGTYLQAQRDICRGEEILVAYGLSYWLGQIPANPKLFDANYQMWIDLIGKLSEAIRKVSRSVILYQVDELKDDDTLIFSLDSIRFCPYRQCNHFDDKLMLKLKKHSEDAKCDVFYKCQTCWRDTFKILTYDL